MIGGVLVCYEIVQKYFTALKSVSVTRVKRDSLQMPEFVFCRSHPFNNGVKNYPLDTESFKKSVKQFNASLYGKIVSDNEPVQMINYTKTDLYLAFLGHCQRFQIEDNFMHREYLVFRVAKDYPTNVYFFEPGMKTCNM